MKKRTERWMAWTLTFVLGFNIIGAVWWVAFRPGQNNLLENGTLVWESIPSPGTSLPHAHAVPVGSTLSVSGRIRFTGVSAAPEKGTLTITALSPDNKILGEVTTNYHLSPNLRHRGGGFSITFPFIPPPRSKIHFQWVSGPDQVGAPPSVAP